MKKFLQSTFDIENDEVKPVGLTFLIGFIWGVSQMFSYTAANTIFLSKYGADYLAYSFIINAVLVPLAGYIIMKLAERFSFSKYITITLVFYCVILAAFLVALTVSTVRLPSMIYLLWIDVENTLSNVLFMSIVNKLFNLRQSKRLYGICSFGGEFAYILGGLVIPIIVKFTGALNLTGFAIGFDVLSLFVFFSIIKSFPDKIAAADVAEDGEESEQTGAPSFLSLLKNRYIAGIVTVASLAAMATCFVENAYFDQLQSYLGDEVKIAQFLSLFYTVSSLFVLLVSGLVTARFMKIFGLSASLLVNPVLVGLITLLFVIASNFGLSALLVFSLVVGVRLTNSVIFSSIHGSAYFNLFQSVPARDRDTAINFSETFMANITSGLAGLVLLVMTQYFDAGARGILIGVEVIIVFWLAICIFLGSEYKKNLSGVLKNKMLRGGDVSLDDPAVTALLLQNLKSSNPTEIINSIDMLEKARFRDIKLHAVELARNDDSGVRIKAAEIYEKHGDSGDVALISEMLAAEKDPGAVAGWLRARGFASEGESIEKLESYLKNANHTIAIGAFSALIKYCSVEGMIVAGSELLRLTRSADANERSFAADVIGEIGLSNLYRLLYPLLKDENMPVRKNALAAAGRLNNSKLIPFMIDNLTNAELRHNAMKGLITAAEKAIPALENLYKNSPASRELVAYLYGRIKGKEAIVCLKQKLSEPDRNVLIAVVHSLETCRFAPDAGDLPRLNGILNAALKYGGIVLCAENDIGGGESNYIVREALKYEKLKNKEYIFSLLTMIYPGHNVKDIRFNYLYSGDEEKIALAIELLDNILHKNHRDLLLSLLEDSNAEKSIAALNRGFPEIGLLGRDKRLNEIISNTSEWRNKWLMSTVYHTIIKSGSAGEKQSVLRKLEEAREQEIMSAVIAQKEKYSLVDKVIILKKAELFSAIPDEVIAKIAELAELVEYPKDGAIFRKGEPGSAFYIVAEGRVKIHSADKIIAELDEGKIFGELSALSPEVRTADATALDRTLLLRLTQNAIGHIIDEQLDVSKGIIRILCQRIRNTIAAKSAAAQKSPAPPVAAEVAPVPADGAAPDAGEDRELTDIEKILILKSVSIFSKLDDAILKDIAGISKEQRLLPNEVLFRTGDSGTSMFVIVHGEVKVHDGDHVIARLGDRKFMGELAALSSESRTASVTALKKTDLLKITQESLYEIMWDYPEVAKGFIQVLIDRLRSLMR